MCSEIKYLIYMYEEDLALNKQQLLISNLIKLLISNC